MLVLNFFVLGFCLVVCLVVYGDYGLGVNVCVMVVLVYCVGLVGLVFVARSDC